MAIALEREGLGRKEEDFLDRMLKIQPKEKVPWHLQKYATAKEPIQFYAAETDVVRIPYAFGIRYLGYFPHDDREYGKIKDPIFQGTLRDRQKRKAIKLDRGFEEARTVILCGHTGFGKTATSIYYIAKFGLLTVVLVPGTVLMEQWPKAIKEYMPNARIKVAGEDFIEEEDEEIDILVCMPDRWHKIPEEVRNKVGFLVVDEAHTFCTTTGVIPLLQFEPRYIMALTASPQRRDGTINVLYALCGTNKIMVPFKTPVIVCKFSTNLVFPTVKDVRGRTNWAGTLKKIVEDDKRNNLIADLAVYLISIGRKPILMCERKYQVNYIIKCLQAREVSCDYIMENKNSYKDSQCLVAIMRKAGTGFDEQYACPEFNGSRIDTVVYCSSFKEINALIQYGGRAFRSDNPLIVHLIDENDIVVKHWKEANKYYQSGEYLKNVTIKKMCSSDLTE